MVDRAEPDDSKADDAEPGSSMADSAEPEGAVPDEEAVDDATPADAPSADDALTGGEVEAAGLPHRRRSRLPTQSGTWVQSERRRGRRANPVPCP